MRLRHREIDLIFGFVAGFCIGLGLALALRLGTSDIVKWGTVGEWVGGIGALAAAIVATWLGLRGERRQDGSRAHESSLYAHRLLRELAKPLSGLKLLEAVVDFAGVDVLVAYTHRGNIFSHVAGSLNTSSIDPLLEDVSLLPNTLATRVIEAVRGVGHVGALISSVPQRESLGCRDQIEHVVAESRDLTVALSRVLDALREFEEQMLSEV